MVINYDEARKVIYIAPCRDLVDDEAQTMHRELLSYTLKGSETLVMDLARVQRIDSIGLETIIAAYNWIRKGEGELIIENASRDVKDLFRLMKLDWHFKISRTGWPIDDPSGGKRRPVNWPY
jgi:anti-anti-sigma factor